MAIHLDFVHYFRFYWHSGKGLNTREKLLGLWGILFCVKWLGLAEIVFFGDSKFVSNGQMIDSI